MPLIDPKTALNFEQRILYPSRYPQINNPDGSYSTHKMAWTTVGDRFIAFPTIVQLPDGNLKELPPSEAIQWAIQNKEFREFPTAEQASGYADGGYKRYWNTGK